MKAFEEAFWDTVAGSRTPEEADNALDSWFRQLSDKDYQRLAKGGRHAGWKEGERYLKETEVGNND